MTYDQLAYFLAAARTGTFSRAAEQCNTTQSSVSKQIRNLEDELGVALFDRSRRSPVLTEAGQFLLADIQSAVNELDHLMADARRYTRSSRAQLRVSYVPCLTQYGLHRPITQFEQQRPDCHLRLMELEEPALRAQLEAGECDLALAFPQALKGFTGERLSLWEDELVLFLRDDDPLCAWTQPPYSALSGRDLMMMDTHTSVYQFAAGYLHRLQIRPAHILLGRIETILGAVDSGRCITLLPRRLGGIYRTQRVVTRPLPGRPTMTLTALVPTGRSMSPTARTLAHLIQDAVSV